MFLELLMSASIAGGQQCKGDTTPEVENCLSADFTRSKGRLEKYVRAAKYRYGASNEAAVRQAIEDSQKAFEAYRSNECNAVYEAWKGGTIRGSMSLACEIRLTDQRTYAVWRNWLTYPDSTPPILPQPMSNE